MTPSPFAQLNAAAIRTERLQGLAILGHWIAAITLVAGGGILGHLALQTALAIPDLTARAVVVSTLQRW